MSGVASFDLKEIDSFDKQDLKLFYCALVKMLRFAIEADDRDAAYKIASVVDLYKLLIATRKATKQLRKIDVKHAMKLFEWNIICLKTDDEKLFYLKLFTKKKQDHRHVHFEVLRHILKQIDGSHPQQMTETLEYVLYRCSNPDVDLITLLLEKGATVDRYDEYEAWWQFIRENTSVECVELLMRNDKHDKSYYLKEYNDADSILAQAFLRRNTNLVKFLIAQGHSVHDFNTHTGRTCLFEVFSYSFGDGADSISNVSELVWILFENRINVEHEDTEGNTALFYLLKKIENCNLEISTRELFLLKRLLGLFYEAGGANRKIFRAYVTTRDVAKQNSVWRKVFATFPNSYMNYLYNFITSEAEALEKGTLNKRIVAKLNAVFCTNPAHADMVPNPDAVALTRVPYHMFLDAFHMVFCGQLPTTHVLHTKSRELYGPQFGLAFSLEKISTLHLEKAVKLFEEQIKKITTLAHTSDVYRLEVAKIAQRDTSALQLALAKEPECAEPVLKKNKE